ncbi:unnamed protein product [Arctogadus glacialis]
MTAYPSAPAVHGNRGEASWPPTVFFLEQRMQIRGAAERAAAGKKNGLEEDCQGSRTALSRAQCPNLDPSPRALCRSTATSDDA